ncbi:hypothetical protein AMJ49_06485 [Parcubacteria bacterium DG_74_2]|nr:MAG: hypothetical protein AMJ49_06485 [Parcubacteria bacterium DG_74_2]
MKKSYKKSYKIIAVISIVIIAVAVGFLIVRASPDSVSDTFSDEANIGSAEKIEIDVSAGQVKLAECYSANPSWTKVADTIVRDINSTTTATATTSKDIYCDDYNCILWTDGAATSTTVCIATDSNVYGNILWSKTDVSGTKQYGEYGNSLTGDQIGGTHTSGLIVGNNGVNVGTKNWLNRYYTSGTFPAMAACKDKGSGWRLPTILELDSIRDQAKGSPYSYLPNIVASDYWSSSEDSANNGYTLYFGNGDVSNHTKSYYSYVRCVRGQ